MREKLIELLKKADRNASDKFITDYNDAIADNAEFLLANGVIVPPCKVGDTVYVKWRLSRHSNDGIYPAKVYALRWDEKKNNFRVCVDGDFEISAYGGKYTHRYQGTFAWNNFGKTVFLSIEEAEKALAKRSKS